MRRAIIILAFLLLAACSSAPVRIQTVETKIPVAVQPIKPSDIPPLPGQLGPRPKDARDALSVALAGRCDAIAFVIRAWPLLMVAAGLPPMQAPIYPECRKR